MAQVAEICDKIVQNVERVVVGKRRAVRLCLVCLLCEGHLLLEDVPGVAKTMLARSLAISLGLKFSRIQCTPDLMPTDVTGASVFNQKKADFEFRPGPIFTNILLSDEINRATPRTQSALLQAMAERQVTVDGLTYELPRPFMVIATQNPVEYEGTFPLPEAQLDRFFMRISLGYPAPADELVMLANVESSHPINSLSQVVSLDEFLEARRGVARVYVDGRVREYLVRLVNATRRSPHLLLGASPRGTQDLFFAARAAAALAGRDFVIPDDIKALAGPVLLHRMMLNPESRLKGITAERVLREILDSVPAPVRQSGNA